MIEFIRDNYTSLNNIVPYDMYVDGKEAGAWICYYLRANVWRFMGTTDFPNRGTRAEAEADAVAWWAIQQLENI